MMPQFPGMDMSDPAIQAELKRIADKPAYDNSDRPPIYFYNFIPGANRVFFLPIYSFEYRMPFRRVYKFYDLPIQDKYKHMCIEKTYPELGLECPINHALMDIRDAGHNVDKYWPAQGVMWQCVTYDQRMIDYKMKEDNKEKIVQFDGSTTPMIIRLTPKIHDILFSYMTDPAIGDFTNPLAAVPMTINLEVGKNGRPSYSIAPMTKSENRIVVPDRTPIWVNEKGEADQEMITKVIGTWVQKEDGKWERQGGTMYNLDKIYAAPLDALKPDGNITKAANQLRAYYGQLNATGTVNTPAPAPGLPTTMQYQQQAAAPPVHNPSVPATYQAPMPGGTVYQAPAVQVPPANQVPPATLTPPPAVAPASLPVDNSSLNTLTQPQVPAVPSTPTPPPAPSAPVSFVPPGLPPSTPTPPPAPLPPVPDGSANFEAQAPAQVAPPVLGPPSNMPRSMNVPEGLSSEPKAKAIIPGAPDCFYTYHTTRTLPGAKCDTTCAFAAVCKPSSPQVA
jgi:hypothetical protein